MKIIKLNDIIKDWDDYKKESFENMFYVYKNSNNLNALQESVNNYKFAVDKQKEIYKKRLYKTII